MTRPKRVLAITVRADIGGGPEHLYQLTSAFGDRVETLIACPQDKPYHERYGTLSNVTQVVEIPHRAFKLKTLWALRALIKDQRIDLIHSHGKGAGLYGRLLAALAGTPCVHTFHGLHIGEYGPAKKAIYLGLERVLGWFTARAIAVSEGEATQIQDAGILPADKLQVIENGVFVPAEVTHIAQSHTLQVIAVNRYDTQKNPELLLDIATALKSAGAPVFITVVGQGDALTQCQNRVTAEGLSSHINLAGPTNTPRAALRDAQVFLSSSRWEGMPLAVLEAMSEGLAVVATDVVGNRDVIDSDHSGLLYPNEDAAAAADLLVALASDPDRRQKLGTVAHEKAKARYSTTRMGQETLKLYDAL